MRMRIALPLALLALLAPAGARALVVLELVDGTGDPGSVNVTPGQTFPLDARLSVTGSTDRVIGVGFWIRDCCASGFALTGRQVPSALFTTLTSTDAQLTSPGDAIAPAGPDNLLDPENDRDLGALTAGLVPFGPGIDVLARLTIATPAALAPGTYTIEISPSAQNVSLEWVDPQFQPHPFDGLGAAYQVVVVPEPSAGALLAAGLAALAAGAARYRPRRFASRRTASATRPGSAAVKHRRTHVG